MINEFIKILISSREILASVCIFLIVLLSLCYYLFNDRASKLVKNLSFGIFLTLISSLLVLLVSYFTIATVLKNLNSQYIALSVLFFLLYVINLIIGFLVDTKNALFKGKKTGDLLDALDEVRDSNISRTTSLLVFLFILLLSIVALGNGRINALVILLIVSGVISSMSCIYILPLFLKISEKVFK